MIFFFKQLVSPHASFVKHEVVESRLFCRVLFADYTCSCFRISVDKMIKVTFYTSDLCLLCFSVGP